MTITDIRPFLAVGVSLLAAFLILFSGKKPNVREFWSVAAACIHPRILAVFFDSDLFLSNSYTLQT